MTSDRRVVLDTNVVVSAVLLPRSIPRQALDQVWEHGTMLIELALSGQASHIISGDEDLLVLHPLCGMPILTPKAFLV